MDTICQWGIAFDKKTAVDFARETRTAGLPESAGSQSRKARAVFLFVRGTLPTSLMYAAPPRTEEPGGVIQGRATFRDVYPFLPTEPLP